MKSELHLDAPNYFSARAIEKDQARMRRYEERRQSDIALKKRDRAYPVLKFGFSPKDKR